MATVWSVLLFLDGAIYDLICFLYDIFDYLSKLNIFKEADYQNIVNRVYIILGLIMLFVLAYSLLRAVINPDEFAKGETSFPNLIKNVVVSLVIIVILPTVFTVAFNIQNSILNNDVIPKLILDDYNLNEENGNGGRLIAFYTFEAFLFPDVDYCDSLGFEDLTLCRMSAGELKGNDGWAGQWGDHITKTDDGVLNQERSFTWYSNYSELVRDGKLKYYFPISTAAGIFILWVMANFCFDMAIRVIKLAFYQIIAPIPVVCRILPGGKMKDVFSNWVRQVISIFAEVFIRIGAMTIGVYLINIIVEMFTGANGRYLPNISSLNWAQRPITMALLIMGSVIFIKQVPKILGDLLKLDTGGMKLGLMDKLAMGGAFAAGGAVGSLISSRGNLLAAGRGFKYGLKNKDFRVIGQEANRRRTQQEALAHGATRRGIMADRVRSAFGFNTRYESNMAQIDARASLIDDQISLLDNQISNYGIQIDNARRPIQAERLEARRDGNKKFTDLKSQIEERAKSRLNREDSNFNTTVRFTTANGNTIEQTGNLHALRQYIQQHSSEMSAEEITEFNRQIYNAESGLVDDYINGVGSGTISDEKMLGYINDIRSNGVLSQVLLDENGNSQLTDAQRNAIVHGNNLSAAIDAVNDMAATAQSDINRRMSDINATARDLEHQRQEVQAQRQELQNQKQIIQSEKSTQENARLRYESNASRNNNNNR